MSKTLKSRSAKTVQKKRAKLRELQSGLCYYCRTYVDPVDESVEHLVPRGEGGSWRLENLALVHRKCNWDENRRRQLQGWRKRV